ncbi:MAG: serine hydrolase [Thermoguttaceae bacterium]
MNKFIKYAHLFLVAASQLLVLILTPVYSAQLDSSKVDQIVSETMEVFQVPGVAVCVIEDGKVVHQKGYGVKTVGTTDEVKPSTNFAIASNSKAFTCVCLGILVDEGKIKWDDKVTEYIPEFRLYSPYVTEEFTIRDLLCHRSGLGLGAGDLMIFPDSGDYTIAEIIYNMRYLKPVSSFRSKYDYDNLLYIVAGEIVSRVSGQTWWDFVETRIMKPLEMDRSAGDYSRLGEFEDVVSPHGVIEGNLTKMDRYTQKTVGAAGGIYSSTEDLAKWLQMLLNRGKYGENLENQIVSDAVIKEIWKPQTIQSGGILGGPFNTHFNCYALGFRISDVKGEFQASHTGGVPGIWTEITLLPERKVGIIVLTNQQCSHAFQTITNSIKNQYLGVEHDWLKENTERYAKSRLDAKKIEDEVWTDVAATQKANEGNEFDMKPFVGKYNDPWFGEVDIIDKDGQLWFVSKRSTKMTGPLFPYKGHTMIAKWTDREMEADAYVKFELDVKGNASGIKMAPVSPLVDFSWDYQDLHFSKVPEL